MEEFCHQNKESHYETTLELGASKAFSTPHDETKGTKHLIRRNWI